MKLTKILGTVALAAAVSVSAVGASALAADPTPSPSASASHAVAAGFTSDPVHVTNAQDEGHHGVWADLEFDRTVKADLNEDNSYTVTMTDDGSFTALPGGKSPRAGVDLQNKGKGTVEGTYTFTVSGVDSVVTDPTAYANGVDEKCTSAAGEPRHCDNRISNEDWVSAYFTGDNLKVTPGDYTWTYSTACEKWVDSSANNDGTDSDAGDITMKNCPAPPVTDKVFTANNVCRVYLTNKGYANNKANVWTVKNNSETPYKIHTAVTYNGKVTWFGFNNRGAIPAHSSITVVSPYGGQLTVRISGITQDPKTDVHATSDHTILCG